MVQRVLTEFRVIIYYISLLIFPQQQRLNLDHDFPLSDALMDTTRKPFCRWPPLLRWSGSRFTGHETDRVIAFCILWFFGNLVIESSIIGLEIIFEHRTYLPSMTAALMMSAITFRYVKSRNMAVGWLSIIVLIFSLWTYQRNNVWQDEITFLQDNVLKSPNKFRPLNNLANALQLHKKYDQAVYIYKKIINENPDYSKAYNNLACLYLYNNHYKEAFTYFKGALRLNPQNESNPCKPWNCIFENKAIQPGNKLLQQGNGPESWIRSCTL